MKKNRFKLICPECGTVLSDNLLEILNSDEDSVLINCPDCCAVLIVRKPKVWFKED